MINLAGFPKRYKYGQGPLFFVFAFLFTGFFSVFMFYEGANSNAPLTISIKRFIEFDFSSSQAPYFFYGLSLLFFLISLLLIYGIYKSIKVKEEIVLTQQSISRLTNQKITYEIQIKDIAEIWLHDYKSHIELIIVYDKGKTALSNQLLQKKKYIHDIYDTLETLVSKAQSATPKKNSQIE